MTPHSHRQSLSGLGVFFRPYRLQIALAAVFLLLAAGTTLAFPWALRRMNDDGPIVPADRACRAQGVLGLLAVALAPVVVSQRRDNMVSRKLGCSSRTVVSAG